MGGNATHRFSNAAILTVSVARTMSTEISTAGTVPLFSSQWVVPYRCVIKGRPRWLGVQGRRHGTDVGKATPAGRRSWGYRCASLRRLSAHRRYTGSAGGRVAASAERWAGSERSCCVQGLYGLIEGCVDCWSEGDRSRCFVQETSGRRPSAVMGRCSMPRSHQQESVPEGEGKPIFEAAQHAIRANRSVFRACTEIRWITHRRVVVRGGPCSSTRRGSRAGPGRWPTSARPRS